METQLFLNVLFGIISFLGGWLVKMSMPEKYVSKDDFQSFVERMDHRFNRLEEKLDALKK